MKLERLSAPCGPNLAHTSSPLRLAPSALGPRTTSPSAVTIGNFDGVHLGHQAMLAQLCDAAKERGLQPCVLTFEPHPRDYFAARSGQPEAAPRRVSTLRDKLAALAASGVERTVVASFDAAMARMSAADFMSEVLARRLQAKLVMVGDDFSFGARRSGNFALLQAEGPALGFEALQMPSVKLAQERVSSSLVRAALAVGDMARALALLGRPYAVSGHVQHGAKLGRELGFRTLNIAFGHSRPAAGGIFVARVLGLTEKPLAAVASFGVRPTVEDAGRVLLETHVLDWPAEMPVDAGYGKVLQVQLLHHLHPELKYAGLDELRQGIAADTQAARQWHASQP